jgi:hypothetical protein
MTVVGRLQKKIEPLIEKVQSGTARPEEIGPKIMKLRKEHERKIESLLSAEQKKRWKDLLGKPFVLND